MRRAITMYRKAQAASCCGRMKARVLVVLLPALFATTSVHAASTRSKKVTRIVDAGVSFVDAGVEDLEPAVPLEDPLAAPTPAAEPEPVVVVVVDAGTRELAVEPPDGGAPEPVLSADPTVLALLLKKNILSMDEFEAASAGLPPPDEGRSPLMGKWAASLYGFVELDAVGDSTQSFAEQSANNPIARPGTFAGNHPRFTFGGRNSRLGLKLASPPFHAVRATAIIEMDFFGNVPTVTTDTTVIAGAGPRFRHLALLLETPVVDVLIGQWWQLFGWQPNFFPSSVEIQGSVGEVYGRTPQLRLSHVFKTSAVNVELAAAALKPPQNDGLVLPDLQAGIRLQVNKVKGLRTSGSTGTRTDSLMFGVSGIGRRFSTEGLNETASVSVLGWGFSADVLVPIIQGSIDDRSNALTLTGSYVIGEGIADQFSALNANIAFPTNYKTSLPNGLVAFDAGGTLRAVAWRAYRGGLQYYLPSGGNIWLALNFVQLSSTNAALLGKPSSTFVLTRQGDANLFFNVTPAFRFGLAYVLMWQQYADHQVARNHRGLVSAFFLF